MLKAPIALLIFLQELQYLMCQMMKDQHVHLHLLATACGNIGGWSKVMRQFESDFETAKRPGAAKGDPESQSILFTRPRARVDVDVEPTALLGQIKLLDSICSLLHIDSWLTELYNSCMVNSDRLGLGVRETRMHHTVTVEVRSQDGTVHRQQFTFTTDGPIHEMYFEPSRSGMGEQEIYASLFASYHDDQGEVQFPNLQFFMDQDI